MRDLMVATISSQPDIEIVGELQSDLEILEAIEKSRPDVLIVTLEESDERPIICDFVLEKFPNMKIIALAPHRNTSMYYWSSLQIHSNRIEASEAGVMNALRGKPQPVRG